MCILKWKYLEFISGMFANLQVCSMLRFFLYFFFALDFMNELSFLENCGENDTEAAVSK